MKRSLRETIEKKEPARAGESADANVPEDIRRIVDRYSGMSEAELMDVLLTETGRRKAEGRFDADSLGRGVNMLMPMLDGEQKKKLREIVGKLERQ